LIKNDNESIIKCHFLGLWPLNILKGGEWCVPRSCTRDEGRPLGAGLQEQALNHLKLHWSRAIVVSVEEKAWQ